MQSSGAVIAPGAQTVDQREGAAESGMSQTDHTDSRRTSITLAQREDANREDQLDRNGKKKRSSASPDERRSKKLDTEAPEDGEECGRSEQGKSENELTDSASAMLVNRLSIDADNSVTRLDETGPNSVAEGRDTTHANPEAHWRKDAATDQQGSSTGRALTTPTRDMADEPPNHQTAPERPARVPYNPLCNFWNAFKPPKSITALATPERRVGKAPGFWRGLRAILTVGWLNTFLIFIFLPLSWAFHWAKPESHIPIFIFSILAIMPLGKLLELATEELSMRVGSMLAGLLNVTLGNAVEMTVAIIALTKCELQVVQSSLIGAILSNLLLVLGMSFFAGGLRYQEQGFLASASQINSSLLTVSVIAILLPGAFYLSFKPEPASAMPSPFYLMVQLGSTPGEDRFTNSFTNSQEGSDIQKFSHGVAIILLFLYGSFLVFQLWSHSAIYREEHSERVRSIRYEPSLHTRVGRLETTLRRGRMRDMEKSGLAHDSRAAGGQGVPNEDTVTGALAERPEEAEAEEEEEMPSMSFPMCIALLAVVTVLTAVTAVCLVDSFDGLTKGPSLSKEWVGLMLWPIVRLVGDSAELLAGYRFAVKDKLTLTIGVAVGSSIQIALFVIPLMVVIAWCLGKPLLMLFDPFESVTLFLSVLTVNYIVHDGKTNWLDGMILMCLYAIIAVVFFFYPGSEIAGVMEQCF